VLFTFHFEVLLWLVFKTCRQIAEKKYIALKKKKEAIKIILTLKFSTRIFLGKNLEKKIQICHA
jgi:hypothetical protein